MSLCRAYRDEDFDALVGMFHETWGWELQGDEREQLTLANLYIACALVQSDWVYVIEEHSQVQAVVCVDFRETAHKAVDVPTYLSLIQGATHVLNQTTTGQTTLRFYQDIDAINERLAQCMTQRNLSWDAEIKLLLTSPQSRGKGYAKTLMQAVSEELLRRRKSWCMLRTDTHCNWSYYERTGWSKAAEIAWDDGSEMTAYAYRRRFD